MQNNVAIIDTKYTVVLLDKGINSGIGEMLWRIQKLILWVRWILTS